MRDRRANERGAALLTVLLLVAIVGAMAAATMERLALATRQASNANAMEQASAWSRAAATMALVRIEAVMRDRPTRITLQGGWSDHPFALPIPDGTATARVRDGGNCFNLNSLVVRTGVDSYAVSMPGVVQFARLLRLLGVPGGDNIAAATADWIDTDGDPIAGGAEDAAYSGFQPAYRPADTLMADVSELRTVTGVTAQAYATIAPYVCALPTTRPAAINVNTLPPERGALIAALAPDTLGTEQVRRALLARPVDGWGSAGEFWSASGLPGSVQPGIAVTTQWFVLSTDVTVGRITLHQAGLIDARQPQPSLVSLQTGEGA